MFRDALRQVWVSPALLGVLFLEFVILFAVTILFWLVPVSSLGVAVALIALQLILSISLSALFAAGTATMMKNAVQDGDTVLGEFLPGVRRHWRVFLAYFLARALIVVLFAVPFLAAVQLVPPVGVLEPRLQAVHYAALALFFAGSAFVTFFWLVWTSAIIAFEDASAAEAMRKSVRFAHANPWRTVRSVLVCAGVFAAAMLLTALVNLPYKAMIQNPPTTGMMAFGALLDVVSFLLFAAALIVSVMYLFGVYATMSKPASRSMRRKVRTLPRK